jgi:hypothetical protein
MGNRFVGLVLAVAVVPALAQVQKKLEGTGAKSAATNAAAAKPDLSGVWKGRNTPVDFANPDGPSVGSSGGWNGVKRSGGGFGFLDYKMEQPSMLPWAAARYKAIREGALDHMQPLKNVAPDINCVPGGFPWIYDVAMLEPFEIVQSPKKIVMLFATDGRWRQIFMDGRKNPEGAPDSFMGYSTGRWEGDVLVVETIGISDLNWIDRLGHPHTDALRVEERIRKVSPDRLDVDLLFDDPKTYTKPWKGKKIYYRQKADVDVTEIFACEDVWRKEYPEKLRKEIGEIRSP